MNSCSNAIQETILRGSPDCPFEFYHIDKNHPKFAMTFHYHLDFEIIRVLQGTFSLYINERHYDLKPGQYIFIEGGKVHGGKPENDDCIYECVVFDLNLLFDDRTPGHGFLKKLSEHSVVLNEIYSDQTDEEITHAFDNVFEFTNPKQNNATIAYGSLLLAFGKIYNKGLYTSYISQITGNYTKQFGRLPILFRYLYDNFQRDISLDEMANTLDLSPKYFCRFFKQITGLRPIEYLNNFRLECASMRLATENESINEIAYSCGFKDPCYFAKIFKNFKKMSPSEYRRLNFSQNKLAN